MRCLLEQHAPLLRALLDTGDSLLVHCCRYSSKDGEWSIGMRERDLRSWTTLVDIDVHQLFDSTTRALADRPPFLGGNRLGFLLMELRREFILKGVFPQRLPELNLAVDTVLGSDSPTEDWDSCLPFDPLSIDNYRSLWPNPFLLLTKRDLNPKEPTDLWLQATTPKIPPPFMPIQLNPTATPQEVSTSLPCDPPSNPSASVLPDPSPVPLDPSTLDEMNVADLRSLFLRMFSRVRDLVTATRQQHAEMDYLKAEIESVSRTKTELEQHKVDGKGAKTEDEPAEKVPSPVQHLSSWINGLGAENSVDSRTENNVDSPPFIRNATQSSLNNSISAVDSSPFVPDDEPFENPSSIFAVSRADTPVSDGEIVSD